MRPPALVLLALLAWSSVASAQLHVGADATAAWPYVWRGLTRANGRVEEVEGFLTLEFHPALFSREPVLLSAGRWWVYEGGAAPDRFSDLGPGGRRLAEVDWWAQGAGRFGAIDITLGTICYKYYGTVIGTGRTPLDNTKEWYVSLRASGKYLAPGFSAYYDADRVRGWYVEGYGGVPVLGSPVARPHFWLVLGALAGFSLGQEMNLRDPTQAANFARSGFTHFDLSVTAGAPRFLELPGTAWQAEGHLQFNTDPATRRTSPASVDRGLRFIFKFSVRWTIRVVRW